MRLGQRVLARLPLGAGTQMARVTSPVSHRDHLVLVTMEARAQYAHVSSGGVAVHPLRLRHAGEQSIGLGMVSAREPDLSLIRGQASGVATIWPTGQVRGVRFRSMDIWAYVTQRLTAINDHEIATSSQSDPDRHQYVWFRGGVRVHSVPGPPSPQPRVVERHSDQLVEFATTMGRNPIWMVLVGPPNGQPVIEYTGHDRQLHRLSLA